MAKGFSSPFAWWYLKQREKELLQQKREEGSYGGWSAAAARRAPYFWPQERGEPKAWIKGKHLVRDAALRFFTRSSADIMRGWFARVTTRAI